MVLVNGRWRQPLFFVLVLMGVSSANSIRLPAGRMTPMSFYRKNSGHVSSPLHMNGGAIKIPGFLGGGAIEGAEKNNRKGLLSRGINMYADYLFSKKDKDSDGVLNFDEFYKVLLLIFIRINRHLPISPPTEEEAKVLFNKGDVDRSGNLSSAECKEACLELLRNIEIPKPSKLLAKRLVTFFVWRGINNQAESLVRKQKLLMGAISFDEFYIIILELYVKINRHAPIPPPKEEKMRLLFNKADKDKSGKLSKEECLKLLKVGLPRLAIPILAHKFISIVIAPMAAVRTVRHYAVEPWVIDLASSVQGSWWFPDTLLGWYVFNEKTWIFWAAICYCSCLGNIAVRGSRIIFDAIALKPPPAEEKES